LTESEGLERFGVTIKVLRLIFTGLDSR